MKYEQVAIIFDKRELVDIICCVGALFEKLEKLSPTNNEYQKQRLKMIIHNINQYFKP